MSEKSAPESSNLPSESTMKEIPPTINMGILVNQNAGEPYNPGNDRTERQPMDAHAAFKPNLTFGFGKEGATLTQKAETTSAQVSESPSTRVNGQNRDPLNLNNVFNVMTSDHFNRTLNETMRQTREEGAVPSPEHTAQVIRETADPDDPNTAWRDKLDEAENRSQPGNETLPADEVETGTGSTDRSPARPRPSWAEPRLSEVPPYLQGKKPSYSTAPYGDRPDPFATGVGDLPPGPSASPDGHTRVSRADAETDPRDAMRWGAERFGLGTEMPEVPEEEKPVVERSKRLAELTWAKGLMDRARKVADNLPELKLKIDPTIAAAIAGAAGVLMALWAQDGRPRADVSPQAMPGRQYSPIEYTGVDQRFVSRPQLPSVVPAEERAAVIDPRQNTTFEPPVRTEAQLGKGPATIEEDFSSAGEKLSVKGVVEDQLAQLLNPEYKAKVEEARAQGKTIDPTEGWAAGTLEDFKNKLNEQYGVEEGQKKYQNIIDFLVQNERITIEDYNKGKVGIGADNDTVVFSGPDRKLSVLDMSKEGVAAIAMGTKGVYSIPGDENYLDQYINHFNPGDTNGR